MGFEELRRDIKTEVFDYQILSFYLADLKKPRDKIMSLISEGKIVRIKKGLYVFGEKWRKAPLSTEMIANLVYGPSCISFEYALGLYGLIPERSLVITSLAIGDTKQFQTPIGVFEYKAIAREKFQIGIEYRDLGEQGGYFIASREKALADLIYRTSGIRTLSQLKSYLFDEMRIDASIFKELNWKLWEEISGIYRKNSVSMVLSINL